MRQRALWTVVALSVLVAVGAAHAALLCDFESGEGYTLGNVSGQPSGAAVWGLVGGTGLAQVTNVPYSGAAALRVTQERAAELNIATLAGKPVTALSFYTRTQSGTSGRSGVYTFFNGDGVNDHTANNLFTQTAANQQIDYYYWNGSSLVVASVFAGSGSGFWPAGSWFNVTHAYNFASNTYSILINGAAPHPSLANIPYRPDTRANSLTKAWLWRNGGVATDFAYFDKIELTDIPAQTHALSIHFETGEGYALGNVNNQPAGGAVWSLAGSTPGVAEVTNSASYDGTNTLITTGGRVAELRITNVLSKAGMAIGSATALSFYGRTESGTAGTVNLYIFFNAATAAYPALGAFGQTATDQSIMYRYWNGATHTTATLYGGNVSGFWSAGQWFKVEHVFDFANNTYTILVNGTVPHPSLQNIPYQPDTTDTTLTKSWLWRSGASASNYALFDNFTVTVTMPPQGTLMIIR
jgi:hypothetical protein